MGSIFGSPYFGNLPLWSFRFTTDMLITKHELPHTPSPLKLGCLAKRSPAPFFQPRGLVPLLRLNLATILKELGMLTLKARP